MYLASFFTFIADHDVIKMHHLLLNQQELIPLDEIHNTFDKFDNISIADVMAKIQSQMIS